MLFQHVEEYVLQQPVEVDAFWEAAYGMEFQDSWQGSLWFYCYFCEVRKATTVGPSCPEQCELGALFVTGWQEGLAQARQAFETGDLAIFEDIGRAAGFTSRRPPRNTRRHTAERDGVNGKRQGDIDCCRKMY